MRTLAIDLGTRRVGLALSDQGGKLATPYGVLEVVSAQQAMEPILEVIEKEGAERLVVGLPLNMDDTMGATALATVRWGEELGRKTGKEVLFVDERLELSMLLRNGEQLLLTVVLPLGLLVLLSQTTVIDVSASTHQERVDIVVPGILALAILSTSFTALAIQTGFERRYGVLRRIGTTPLSRADVLGGKARLQRACHLVLAGGVDVEAEAAEQRQDRRTRVRRSAGCGRARPTRGRLSHA